MPNIDENFEFVSTLNRVSICNLEAESANFAPGASARIFLHFHGCEKTVKFFKGVNGDKTNQ